MLFHKPESKINMTTWNVPLRVSCVNKLRDAKESMKLKLLPALDGGMTNSNGKKVLSKEDCKRLGLKEQGRREGCELSIRPQKSVHAKGERIACWLEQGYFNDQYFGSYEKEGKAYLMLPGLFDVCVVAGLGNIGGNSNRILLFEFVYTMKELEL